MPHPPSRVLFVDPWAGVSGDMLLAALLDLGRDDDHLERILRTAVDALGLGAGVRVERVIESGLRATRVTVDAPAAAPLRTLVDLERPIDAAGLSDRVSTGSLAALRRLAEVEGSLHGVLADQVHFHEVGAVDTVVDVVGAFALIEALQVEAVFYGPVPVGAGSVPTAHGRLGVPAPATLELLSGVPVVGGLESTEVATPTGALLLTALGTPGRFPAMVPQAVGYGAGSRTLQHGPNVLRAVLGDSRSERTPGETGEPEALVLLETNLDDTTGEVVSHLQQALMAAGARDAWTSPVFMKKGRPGVQLSVLVGTEAEEDTVELMFRESGTFGIRRRSVDRHVLERTVQSAGVGGHEVAVKVGRLKGRVVTVAAEYEDAVQAAAALGRPLREVMDEAVRAVRESIRE